MGRDKKTKKKRSSQQTKSTKQRGKKKRKNERGRRESFERGSRPKKKSREKQPRRKNDPDQFENLKREKDRKFQEDRKKRSRRRKGSGEQDNNAREPDPSETQSAKSVDTFEALNLIDERLLEDINPQKLSFLKREAERRLKEKDFHERRRVYKKMSEDKEREPFNELSVNKTACEIKNFIPSFRYRSLSYIERPRRRSKKRKKRRHEQTKSPPYSPHSPGFAYLPPDENNAACQCAIM